MTDQNPQAWVDRDELAKVFEGVVLKSAAGQSFASALVGPKGAGVLADALLASGIISRKPSEDEVAEMLLGANVGYHHHRLVIARAVLSAKGEGV